MGSLNDSTQIKGHINYYRYNFVKSKLKELRKQGYRTGLEIGPSDGAFAECLINCGFETESLGKTANEFPWPHHVMDIQEEYLNKEFDIIMVGEVLEHLNRPCRSIINIRKMGNQNSQFIISVPNFNSLNHIRTYTEEEFHDLLSLFFDILETKVFCDNKSGVDREQYLMVGKKKEHWEK